VPESLLQKTKIPARGLKVPSSSVNNTSILPDTSKNQNPREGIESLASAVEVV